MVLEVHIDFDGASKAWKMNKKSIGNGSYRYICGRITKKGTPCQRNANCHIHKKK